MRNDQIAGIRIGVPFWTSLVPSVLLVGSSVVWAGGHGHSESKPYEVSHQFKLPIQYPAGTPQEPGVWMLMSGKALATNPGSSDRQPLGPYNFAIPSAGATHSESVTATAHDSTATASAEGTVDPFGTGSQAITGRYKVRGETHPKPVIPGTAEASSAVSIRARGQSVLAGQVRYGPDKMIGISHRKKATYSDPLSLKITDPASGATLLDETLFDVTFELTDGAFSWVDNRLTIDAWEGAFFVSIPGVVTNEQGALSLVLSDGALISAHASGLFAGLTLPGIGETQAFSLDLQNIYDLTLNLPNLDPTHGYEFEFGMSSSGMSLGEVIPEPHALTLIALALATLVGCGRPRR